GGLRFFAFWLHQLDARRCGARSRRPLRNAWKARDRIARHVCRRVNCSAFWAKPRRNAATAASALAAGLALACELVTRIVVCRACRVRVAMADRNKGRLVTASRWRLGSARRTKMVHQS